MPIEQIVPAALAMLLVAGSLVVAQAKDSDHEGRDATTLASMKVSLTQAIATAEQQAGGRAVGADVVQEQGTTRIAVEVAGPEAVKTVLMEAGGGQVTATHSGGHDTEDNN